jgi:Protein of unknown function (DUF3179)
MFDRKTFTLWSNLTGEPVVGPLSQSSTKLMILPMTLTTWGEWQKAHPDTTVVYLDQQYGNHWGFRYAPGAADQVRVGVNFPIWLKNKILKDKEEIYAIRIGEHAKAYPINLVVEKKVINDQLGEHHIVIIGDPRSGAIRVYERNGHDFSSDDSNAQVRDQAGQTWRIKEEGLVLADSDVIAEKLRRIPGHVSLWFAWYGFFPQTEVYGLSK